MTSKPTTPLSRRKPFVGDPATRLPQLSPSPIRRSESLRLRPVTASRTPRLSPSSPPNTSNGCGTQKSSRLKGCVGREERSPQPASSRKDGSPLSETRGGCRRKVPNMTLNLTPSRPRQDSSGNCGAAVVPSSSSSNSRHLQGNGRPGGLQKSPTTTTGGSGRSSHRGSPPKTPPVTPDSVLNDDMDSEFSCSSAASCCWSSGISCDHNGFAPRNGTTFSGRRNKYVVHCSTYAGQVGQEYLTPTQRAQRHIRRLKELLQQARVDVEHRDSEIMKLTREVVELRLFKASLDRSSPEEKSNSSHSEAVTVKENNDPKTSADVSPIVGDTVTDGEEGGRSSPRHHHLSTANLTERLLANSSLADSGHFDDMTTTSSLGSQNRPGRLSTSAVQDNSFEQQRAQLVAMYEKRIAELMQEYQEKETDAKRGHNEHVEALLTKLADSQSRYSDLMMDHETAKEKIRELERKLDELQMRLNDEMDEKNKMYLEKFRREHDEPVAGPSRANVVQGSSRVSVAELMQQLQVTQDELENVKAKAETDDETHGQTLLSAKEAISLWLVGARKTMYERLVDQNRKAARANKVDPEVTLQFLKSAIYYFLTDKENSQGHLAAIESILGFTEEEKQKIDKSLNRKSF